MDYPQTDWKEMFPLLKQMMSDAFRVDSALLSPPYDDTSLTDRGLRRMVWKDFSFPPAFFELVGTDACHLLIVRSALGFTNLIAVIGNGDRPDIISVGPFCETELSLSFMHKIAERNHLTEEYLNTLQEFYRTLPLLDASQPMTMLRHFLGYFLPAFSQIDARIIDYGDTRHTFEPDADRLNSFTEDIASSYIHYLQNYLDTLSTGNTQAAFEKLQIFMNMIHMSEERPQTMKLYLHTLNTAIFLRLIDENLPPANIFTQYHAYTQKIENAVRLNALSALPLEMTRKYSLMMQNYGYQDYPPLIRNTMQYISLHLDETLTLESLAADADVSPGHLSHQFRSQTDEQLMVYIQKERMHAAIRLFNTTNLPIQEVASAVGIHDAAYFSRLFKKHIGQTPREYKKMLNRHQP